MFHVIFLGYDRGCLLPAGHGEAHPDALLPAAAHVPLDRLDEFDHGSARGTRFGACLAGGGAGPEAEEARASRPKGIYYHVLSIAVFLNLYSFEREIYYLE